MSGFLNGLRDWFEKLEPRERKLVGLFAAALSAFVLAIVPIGASAMLGSRRAENRELRDAIFAIRDGRDAYAARQAKRAAIAARYANKAPPLAGALEKAARDNKLEVPESQDRPETPHGKRYTERNTVVRLRKASMLQLSKMLEQLEQMHMPISISRLNVRRRGGEKDSYDVELGVSAFDRNEPAPAAGGADKDKTAAPGQGAKP
jgi:general secretion pathway protein M